MPDGRGLASFGSKAKRFEQLRRERGLSPDVGLR